ncbi:MAG: hypothetical protein L3K06_07030 [Thermoplasmata archaeon]|nr:hypothetical protein [Thermoplasmata archaeon]
MTTKERVAGYKADALPGIEMLRTDAALEVAHRTQFTGGFGSEGDYVYVNGYDLARVEAAGLNDPSLFEMLERHGWFSPDPGLRWFRRGDPTYTPRTLADAILIVVTELENPVEATYSTPDD